MPVVSRSNCTQIGVELLTKIVHDDGAEFTIVEHTNVDFNTCEGIDDNDNNSEANFELLVEKGIATPEELEILRRTLVGEDKCEDAINDFLH
jgi:hypothetical protein